MIFPIRMAATIDLARETFAYYRVLNTALFIRALVTHFNVMEILPLLVVGQLPLVCYFLCVFIEPELRKRAHKIIIGLFINKLISPFLSLTVFTTVALNLGSQGTKPQEEKMDPFPLRSRISQLIVHSMGLIRDYRDLAAIYTT